MEPSRPKHGIIADCLQQQSKIIPSSFWQPTTSAFQTPAENESRLLMPYVAPQPPTPPGSSHPMNVMEPPNYPSMQMAMPNGNGNGMMAMLNTSLGMASSSSSIDNSIRTILAFQAHENAVFREEMAKRQMEASSLLTEVTKILMKEQEANRSFQKEIIESFAKVITAQIQSAPSSVIPEEATPEVPEVLEKTPVLRAPKQQSGSSANRKVLVAKRRIGRVPGPTITHNRKILGKGKEYDATIGDFTVFDCKFCAEQPHSRDELIKHSERYHPRK